MPDPHVLGDVHQDGGGVAGRPVRRQDTAGEQACALGDGVVDLGREVLRRRAGGQRRVRDGVYGLGLGHERGHERVVDVGHHEHAFVRVAGLPVVVDPRAPGQGRHSGHVGGVEHDERVRAAEFEHALLQVPPRGRGDDRSGALGSCQRHTLNPGIGDDGVDLLVGGEDVEVSPVGQTRVEEHLLKCAGGERDGLGVLDDHGVAQHEVRDGEARDLIAGVVPGHDTQQGPDRAGLHDRTALTTGHQLLLREQCGALVRVVVEDRRAVLDLVGPLGERLAHLQPHGRGQFAGASYEPGSRSADEIRAFGDGALPPAEVRRLRGAQDLGDLGVGGVREGADQFTGRGIDDLIGGLPRAWQGHEQSTSRVLS